MTDYFGEMRSLFQQATTWTRLEQWTLGWRQLCFWIEQMGFERFVDRYIVHVQQHLQAWPDEVRQLPTRWQQDEHLSQYPALISLARVMYWPLFDDSPTQANTIRRWKLGMDLGDGAWHDDLFLPPMRLNEDITQLDEVDYIKEIQQRVLSQFEQVDTLTHLAMHMALDASTIMSARLPLLDLQHLDLSYNALDDLFMGWLANQPMPSLTSLWLADNQLTSHGLSFLIDAPWRKQLQSLHLGYHDFTDALIGHLVSVPWPELRHLYLRACGLRALGAHRLLDRRLVAPLHTLDLLNNNLEVEGVAALLANPALSELRTLQLGRTHGGAEAISTLPGAAHFQHLLALGLRSNALGDDGARALAATDLPSLEQLDLSYNSLGERGMQALVDAPWMTQLRTVSMAHNQLGVQGLDLWSWGLPDGQIEALDLSRNELGDHGMSMLADWPALGKCHHLVLRRNQISARGIAHLVGGQPMEHLRVLDLKGNAIGLEGARLLCEAPFLPQLHRLELRSWDVTPQGMALLATDERVPPHLQKHFARYLR